jgi:hypothetical protein
MRQGVPSPEEWATRIAEMIPVHVYRNICFAGAVIGIATSAYFLVTGPADVGWVLLVLTVLLLPAYLLYARAIQRGNR